MWLDVDPFVVVVVVVFLFVWFFFLNRHNIRHKVEKQWAKKVGQITLTYSQILGETHNSCVSQIRTAVASNHLSVFLTIAPCTRTAFLP